MAIKDLKRSVRRPKAGGLVMFLEVLNERLHSTETWAKLNQHYLHKDTWVVYPYGDSFSHYVSIVGNLTGDVRDAREPTFNFIRSKLKEGLPREAFDRIKGAIATSSEELSLITEIPARTIARRKRFKPDESERLFRVASAFQKTLELFEDLKKARKWFTTPKSALAGLTPIQCCDTEAGCKEVENLLGRLDESVYS
jgi:putative toxin-antitoxin system antitoxin component (TIGR02293 family)